MLGVQVNTWGVNDLADAVAAAEEADVDALVAEYDEAYDVVPELRADGERRESLRDGARLELGLRSFLEEGGFDAFTTNFEDLGALRAAAGPRRAAADGGRLRLRRRGRLEDGRARAHRERHGGGPARRRVASWRTTPTTSRPDRELILGAHMLEVSPSLTTQRPSLEMHPLGIGGREDPVRLVFDADPGPAVVVALSDLRDRFRLVANVVDVVAPAGAAAEAARRARGVGAARPTSAPPRRPG